MKDSDSIIVEMLIADIEGDVEQLAMRYKNIDEFRYYHLGKDHLILSVLSLKADQLLEILMKYIKGDNVLKDIDVQRAIYGLSLYNDKIKKYNPSNKIHNIQIEIEMMSRIETNCILRGGYNNE